MILRRISEQHLRYVLGGFLLALLIPTFLLVLQAYLQLERDTFFQHRTTAEELARRIDEQLAATVQAEDEREFSDYGFLVVAGADFVQRSPLSGFPVESPIPGTRSYFQLDADGKLTTPLLPTREADATTFGITAQEYAQRLAVQNEVLKLLSQPEPPKEKSKSARIEDIAAAARGLAMSEVTASYAPISAPASAETEYPHASDERLNSQVVLDRLQEPSQSKVTNTLGRVEDLKLDAPYAADYRSDADRGEPMPQHAAESAAEMVAEEREFVARDSLTRSLQPQAQAVQKKGRARRLEQNVAPAERGALETPIAISLETFTSEVEPFRFATLDAENFVLYRTVWRDQVRYIQGLVIARDEFLRANIGSVFGDSAIASLSDLIVAYEGNLLQAYNSARRGYLSSADDVTGTLLHQARMSPPFNNLELIFSAVSLPVSAGSAFIMWTAAALIAVLFGGFWLIYRLGLQQITLNRQQQDFVSAVSHELKTPLTSIRMYGEILKAGWASEDKKRTYYDFIFQESERLSRLINNVLQLARLTRSGTDLDLQPTSIGELADLLRSNVSSLVEQAQFELLEHHEDESASFLVDNDSFIQIVINLVDNAIKFSAASDIHRIEIKSRRTVDDTIEFSVRDHGPGVPKDQMRRIFELFYRTERELTRETVGTGIGLALVHELVSAMGGRITVQNMDPGVEFKMQFPAQTR
jgi:signal transduction histidine kinase